MDERFKNELSHLSRLKAVLDNDSILTLRLGIERQSLDFRRFRLTIEGTRSLVNNPTVDSSPVASTFAVTVEIPSGYPWTKIPDIRFEQPIPFHPHVYPTGAICWGTGNDPQPDLTLADWVYLLVEYLQYNQDEGSHLRMNISDSANGAAGAWLDHNRRNISRYVPTINMPRLRAWVDRSRG